MKTIVELTAGHLGFEPQDIEAMSTALENVCEALAINGNVRAREIVAIRIIELARSGERRPEALRDRVLAEANSGSGC